MDPSSVRTRVRQLIASGAIPCERPRTAWAGQGMGRLCLVCVEPIEPTEIEYEVEFARVTFRVHLRCHAIWHEECEPLTRTDARESA